MEISEKWKGTGRAEMSERTPSQLLAQRQRLIDEMSEEETPVADTALDLLQAVYRSLQQPLSVRMRAAAMALPFESPKLAVIATNTMSGERFAELLDRAIARSKAPYAVKQIELKAEPEPADE
jgi:hypothetical protein